MSYDDGPRDVAVALVGPSKSGKTALVAALDELFRQGQVALGEHEFDASRLEGAHGLAEADELAMRELDRARRWLECDRIGLSSTGWYGYRTTVRGPSGPACRLTLLDAIGESLFPLHGPEGARRSLAEYPSLRRRCEELGLGDAEHVLLFLLGAPERRDQEGSADEPPIPEDVAIYLRSVRFSRVVLLVSGADRLEPAADLEEALSARNRRATSSEGSAGLGARDRARVRELLGILRRECRIEGARFGVFWASATGHRSGDDASWRPTEVIRPLLWAAGFANEDVGV